MLFGIDVSSYQKNMNFGKYDFVIIKASEGNDFKDPALDRHYNNLVGNSTGKPTETKLYGFYHYARPELGSTPEEEADFFVSLVGHHKGSCLYALDWEGNSLKYSPEWALRWLKRVYAKTGVRPVIYLQGSEAVKQKYKCISDSNFGLWVAHWGVKKPMFSNWNFYALHQYQGSPLDKDTFNGDKKAWKLYCKSAKINKPVLDQKDSVIKIGDIVKVTTVKNYNNIVNDAWVLKSKFEVMEVSGDRVVIGKHGVITGAWKLKDIRRV